jgi:SNF2 family DNA or RNA helicase
MILVQGIIGFVISICVIIISLICSCARKEVIGGATAAPLTQLQREVAREYNNLKLPSHKIPFEEFCYPRKFKLQNPQKFIAEYMAPDSPHMNLLGFHRIGAGKTCAAIQAAEMHMSKAPASKPLIVMPASLVPGFRNELRSPCADLKYITEAERDELKILKPSNPLYKEIIKRSDALIDARYDIMSYNKFIKKGTKLNPSIMIIDEVHNVNNPTGTYYSAISKFVRERPKMKLIVLSATPIFDRKDEIVSLLRLMRIDVTYELLNKPVELRKTLDGLISYYAGAPENTFPKTTIHYEICRMGKFQSKWFKAEVEGEVKKSGKLDLKEVTNNFYAKSRAKSNIVFPHGLAGTDGLPKLSKAAMQNNLDTYSVKFAKLMKKLRKGQLSFVFSNFVGFGGIKTLVKCLRAFGYTDYRQPGSGRKFAIWSGEETSAEKNAIRKIYNSKENDDGKLIQVIVGSPAIKEGVSLLRCRQVHILDPYWNYSRLEQIYGRAVRFCSHKTLPKRERTVDIYLYVATTRKSKLTKANFLKTQNIDPNESIDGYILKLADEKRKKNNELLSIMIESSVDRGLNQRK